MSLDVFLLGDNKVEVDKQSVALILQSGAIKPIKKESVQQNDALKEHQSNLKWSEKCICRILLLLTRQLFHLGQALKLF